MFVKSFVITKASKHKGLNRADTIEFTSYIPYKFGYQGSEKDDEIAGVTGSHYTTFFRELDTRIGRWWSVDPETNKTPWESPYCSMGDNPIKGTDPLGNSTNFDGFENDKGEIIYNDKTDASYKDDKGTTWTNIGKENNSNWSQDKQLKFGKAKGSYLSGVIQSNNKTIKHLANAMDITTDVFGLFVWPVGAAKSAYSLINGTNPIRDLEDLGTCGNNKEEILDNTLSAADLTNTTIQQSKILESSKSLMKFAKAIPIIGAILTSASVSKTVYDAYIKDDKKKEEPKKK